MRVVNRVMGTVPLKTEREIGLMRESCRIVKEVLALVGARVHPGVTTRELDTLAEEYIRMNGGIPAFKGYGHDKHNLFPASLCISVDAEVVHGIPDGRRLEEGQVVSIDVGVEKEGFFGDGAFTFPVGAISAEKERLLRVTRESLAKGIGQAKAGNRLHDVSWAIQRHVEDAGYSVVRDLVGHGIGKHLHEEPAVPNFGERGTGVRLREGMALAIEPMVNAGTHDVEVQADGWTVLTQDRMPSAHFEHTIVVRKDGAEILTQ